MLGSGAAACTAVEAAAGVLTRICTRLGLRLVFASYCLGLALYRVLNTLLGRWASASAIALICSSLFVAVDVTRMYVTTSAFEVSFAAVAKSFASCLYASSSRSSSRKAEIGACNDVTVVSES